MVLAAPGSLGKGDHSSFPTDLSPQSTSPSQSYICCSSLQCGTASQTRGDHPQVLCDPPELFAHLLLLGMTAEVTSLCHLCQVIQTLCIPAIQTKLLLKFSWMKCTLSCLMAQSHVPHPPVILSLVPLAFFVPSVPLCHPFSTSLALDFAITPSLFPSGSLDLSIFSPNTSSAAQH